MNKNRYLILEDLIFDNLVLSSTKLEEIILRHYHVVLCQGVVNFLSIKPEIIISRNSWEMPQGNSVNTMNYCDVTLNWPLAFYLLLSMVFYYDQFNEVLLISLTITAIVIFTLSRKIFTIIKMKEHIVFYRKRKHTSQKQK